MTDLKSIARQIFHDALSAVDVRAAVEREITVTHDALTIANTAIPLNEIRRVIIIALGKAAAPMHAAARKALEPTSVPIEAIVVAPEETHDNTPARFFAGAHPLPDERSILAAHAVLDTLHTCDERTAVLFLISGGASAMLELPLDQSISIEDVCVFNQALIGSGLRIEQMNALRKHLSAVKGGRLAVAAQNARQMWSLLISDVPAAAPDVIASGPSLPDTSTLAECRDLLDQLMEKQSLPASIKHFTQSTRFVETPRPHDPAFSRACSKVILSSEHLAQAAAEAAYRQGYEPIVDNTCDEWEYLRAGEYLLQEARALSKQHGRHCIISVGEITVELPSQIGKGGRNQQLALWMAQRLANDGNGGRAFLSAGSDGIDGNSHAAGAVVDSRSIGSHAPQANAALQGFDAASFFATHGGSIVTGPTGNNLRDLRLFIVDV